MENKTNEYSAGVRLVLKTVQHARVASEYDHPRFTYAIHALMDLSPADSIIVRALHEDAIWDSGSRSQFRRYMRDPAHNVGPGRDIGLRAEELIHVAETHATVGNAVTVNEFHLAKALVDRAGDMLRHVGIQTDAFVQRVQELESRPIENFCFVLMPFSDDLATVYRSAIQQGIWAAGLRCERADEIDHPGIILDQIDDLIRRALVIVADLTSANPNVMQEVGFARAAGKPIVFLTQDQVGRLPFDVRHYRIIRYERSDAGLLELTTRLTKTLVDLRRGKKLDVIGKA